MRFRVGLLLCLLTIIAGVGCRKALAPNIDRNKAPETWITAAPFDTITMVKGETPQIGTIPIRFHVYWAGGDRDGAVVGYYWAVVETLPFPPEGSFRPPPLPGPRPADYHYTTRSDSTFIFNVAEDVPDRLHAFFIYAVDDQGKADPTPARFIFNAQDRFPPRPVFDQTVAVGTVYFFDDLGILQSEVRTFPITDVLEFDSDPRDTVSSGSRVTFRFHGEVRVAGGTVEGFRYKLDESELQPSNPDSLYHKNFVEYHVPAADRDPARHGEDTVAVATGTKVFTLRVVDQASGSEDSTRRFQMNFSPDTWFAGPDPDVTGAPWVTKPNGEKYALLVDGKLPPGGLPGSLMGPDSVRIMPSQRVPHRTFLEVYRDTVFLRKEFDTVHMAAWVIIHNGGFDRDSPYRVHVADGIQDLMPGFPGGAVLTPAGQNGSPVGFRSRITNFLTPNGPLSFTAQSGLYPLYDPNDVQNFPRIAAYHPMFQSGKAYSLQRAEDGDQARDGRVGEARNIVEFPANAYEQSLRPLVLVFYVNFPPILLTTDPSFRPHAAVVDTFYSTTWDLRIPGDDIDPYASGDPYGGPSAGKVLRRRFTVAGVDTNGAPYTFSDPPPSAPQQRYFAPDCNILVPELLGTGPATITVELCDCSFCELNAGEGRCITRDFQVYYKRPPSAAAARASRPGLELARSPR
jgi:hypothetical protein